MTRRIGFGGSGTYLAGLAASGRWWTWASATARNATVVSDADIGRTGYQTDMARQYMLIAQTAGVGRWGPLADPQCGDLQTAFARVQPAAAAWTKVGMGIDVVGGTGAAVAATSTNKATALQRLRITSASGTGNNILVRGATSNGNCSAQGVRWRFRVVFAATMLATQKWGMGIIQDSQNAINTNVTYTDLLNCILVGRPAGTEDNVQLWYNDGTVTGTTVDLGAAHPANTTNTGYEVEFYTADGTTWAYQLFNIVTRAEVSGTFTGANVPANTVQMSPVFIGNTNLTNGVLTMDPVDVHFDQLTR